MKDDTFIIYLSLSPAYCPLEVVEVVRYLLSVVGFLYSQAGQMFPPPPPPISDDSNAEENNGTPQRPGLTRRATDKVALFVAALEGKSGGEETRSPGPASPLRHGESFSFSATSPVRKESAAQERPEFHKRTSSSIGFVVLSDKQNSTVLHPRPTGPYLSYSHVKWKLNIRKEVSLLLACSP